MLHYKNLDVMQPMAGKLFKNTEGLSCRLTRTFPSGYGPSKIDKPLLGELLRPQTSGSITPYY